MLLWKCPAGKSHRCQPRLGILDHPTAVIRPCVAAIFGIAVFALQASAGFVTAPTYAAGSNPASVAVGDFNGDGFPGTATLLHRC
jgi:hypothetical protein